MAAPACFIDGDQAGIAREQAIFQCKPHGFPAYCFRVGAKNFAVFERLDFASGPQGSQVFAARRGQQAALRLPVTFVQFTADRDGRRLRRQPRPDPQRFTGIQVRYHFRVKFSIHTPVHTDVLDSRVFNPGPEAGDAFLHLVDVTDVGMAAASYFRCLAHEPGVGSRADGHREQPAVAQLLADLQQQFLFIAHAAVCHEYDLAKQAVLPGQFHGHVQCRGHDRSAIGRQAVDKILCLLQKCRVGRFGLPEQAFAAGTETHQVEPVVGLEKLQSELQRFSGLVHRRAAHGAGCVDNEHDLARLRREGFRQRRRQHQQGENRVAVVESGQGRLGRTARFRSPGQFE